jgi:transposase
METRTTSAYRVYPNQAQETRQASTLETARRLCNHLMAERRAAYEGRRETVEMTALLQRAKERMVTDPSAAGDHSHVLQLTVARREKGGASRQEAVRCRQRHHEHVANQRPDFLISMAHWLITGIDWVALENLHLPDLVRIRHLAPSILDAGWGCLARQLTREAASAGRVVRLVDPAHTSQDCWGCGRRFEGLTLKGRCVLCGPCGLSQDRAHNAPINILRRAGLHGPSRAGHALELVHES